MADYRIHPGRLRGEIIPPPSKSDAHRALIAAALAGGSARVENLPVPRSNDILATERCLRQLLGRSDSAGSDGIVHLDCGESGTTLRLMIPLAAALGRHAVFTGQGRLPSRPLAEYNDILATHGVDLKFPNQQEFYLPLEISGQLQPGHYQVPGHISSQYISGLLFALPLLAADSSIELLTPLASAPYVEMTLAVLHHFSIRAAWHDGYLKVPGKQKYLAVDYTIEPDYSQAAFWLTAAWLGNPLQILGLPAVTQQGDQMIHQYLAALKTAEKTGTVCRIDAAACPDLVPILAVAAVNTAARTDIVHAARLRFKESDRLQATADALRAIGADIFVTEDGLTIHGCGDRGLLQGGVVDSHGDHRIVMALAVAALRTQKGVVIHGAEAVNKSYPTFFTEWKQCGGQIDELNVG